PGRKFISECMNEPFDGIPSNGNWIPLEIFSTSVLGRGGLQFYAQGYVSAMAWEVAYALFSAAGRAGDFIPAVNSNGFATGEIFSGIKQRGTDAGYDAATRYHNLVVMTGGYVDNDSLFASYVGGGGIGWGPAGAAADRLSTNGLVSLCAQHCCVE